MTALLSIKPKYVDHIKSGYKKYEFRKKIFKRDVSEIYIYSSSPDKKIIGYFNIKTIIEDTPDKLWKVTSKSAGISKKDFDEYYKGKDIGFAIEIGTFNEFISPLCPYKHYSKFTAPQSFMYLNDLSVFKGRSLKC